MDWEAAYHEGVPRLYNFFRYRVGDNDVAGDLTAETFTRAWRDRHHYRYDLAAFSTWLFMIAKQVVADYFRKPHPEVSLTAAIHIPDEETVESLVQQRSDFERLSTLLAKLTDRDRELFALKYGASLTNRTIADVSGMSESNFCKTTEVVPSGYVLQEQAALYYPSMYRPPTFSIFQWKNSPGEMIELEVNKGSCPNGPFYESGDPRSDCVIQTYISVGESSLLGEMIVQVP